MGWSCGSIVASPTSLHCRLPTKHPTPPPPPSAPAPPPPPRSTASALPAGASPPSPPLRCGPPSPFAPSHSRIPQFPFLRHGYPCNSPRGTPQLRRAAEYVFPDPIPEFADAETDKFRSHLMEKLSKKDIFETSVEEVVGICTGETDKFRSHLMEKLSKDIFETSVEEVVGICTGILSEFLQTEYGGPGTLLVIPFIDMADTINERGLPGAPQAARAAVVWAQKHVDKDWKEWTGSGNNN